MTEQHPTGQDPAGPHLLHEWLTNPNVPAELRQAAQQKAAELFAQSAEDESYDDLLTADDILTTDWPEPRWAIPKLTPIGLSILGGRAKLGKSWLALQIAYAVAAGGVALGQQVEQGAVLYLALEDNPRRLKERMQQQRWQPGLPVDFVTIGQFSTKIGNLYKGGAERLARRIAARNFRLVIIDTLARTIQGDQNDYQEMTAALTPLQETAHAQNCAIVAIDHHNKLAGLHGSEAGDVVSDLQGSTAKGGMADTIWGLYRERGKAGAKLGITGRDVDERVLSLLMDWTTGCWQNLGEAHLVLSAPEHEIMTALHDLHHASVTQVMQATGQSMSHVSERLALLADRGYLTRKRDGRHVIYALPDDHTQPTLPQDSA